MNIPHFTLPLLCSVLVSAADYEVTIDGKTHAFTEGVAQTIPTAGGEVQITVNTPRLKVCQEEGFTFDYPREMTLECEDLEGGIRQFTVSATDSTLIMVQRYPKKMNPAELEQSLATSLQEGYRQLGAVFPDKPSSACRRKIGANEVKGSRLSYELATLPHTTDLYVLTHGDRTVVFVLQCADEDAPAARPRFAVVAESLR